MLTREINAYARARACATLIPTLSKFTHARTGSQKHTRVYTHTCTEQPTHPFRHTHTYTHPGVTCLRMEERTSRGTLSDVRGGDGGGAEDTTRSISFLTFPVSITMPAEAEERAGEGGTYGGSLGGVARLAMLEAVGGMAGETDTAATGAVGAAMGSAGEGIGAAAGGAMAGEVEGAEVMEGTDAVALRAKEGGEGGTAGEAGVTRDSARGGTGVGTGCGCEERGLLSVRRGTTGGFASSAGAGALGASAADGGLLEDMVSPIGAAFTMVGLGGTGRSAASGFSSPSASDSSSGCGSSALCCRTTGFPSSDVSESLPVASTGGLGFMMLEKYSSTGLRGGGTRVTFSPLPPPN